MIRASPQTFLSALLVVARLLMPPIPALADGCCSCCQAYDVVVAPREEASMQYSFTPNKAIVPREFLVALTAFYTNPAGQARLEP